MQINILESKNRLSQLVRLAQQGEEVIIANRGIPAVKLVPVNPASDTDQHDILTWLDNHPLPQALRRSGQEIDDALVQERQGWD